MTSDPAVSASSAAGPAPLAIVAAMRQELHAVLALPGACWHTQHHAGREFHCGTLHGQPVVAVLCGIGKVAAALTTTLLAERHGVRALVFTGVAGGLAPQARVGDVVLGRTLLQHDMDASPLFPRFEVPLTGRSRFDADAALSDRLACAVEAVLASPSHYGAGVDAAEVAALGVQAPRLYQGLIVSGDRFVSSAAESQALQQALPEALAVEMEGAAIAQVCHDLGLPFAVLRTISDRADDSAHVDFTRFIDVVAAQASAAIVDRWLRDEAGTASAAPCAVPVAEAAAVAPASATPAQPVIDALQALTHLPQDAQRIFHGRGGRHPGCEHLSLDWYAPVWLLTAHGEPAPAEVQAIGAALAQTWARLAPPDQPLNWLLQVRDEARADNRLQTGAVPADHVVAIDGLRFRVHLDRGLNHGLFLDMVEGHRWVRRWAQAQPGGRVLNLFAYSGAFSVAALAGGASTVWNVDMARGALASGQRNHELNDLQGRASFLPHDLWNTWGKLTRGGPWDLVIMDPPAYQKGSFVAEKDWPRLLRRLPELLAPGGHALLCLNAPRYGSTWLAEQVAAAAPQLRPLGRLPNPPVYADIDEERALKVMVWQQPEDAGDVAG
ncbi:MAG: hypothetical protein RL223_3243 [Pseudomonadota bacterium]